MRTVIALLLLLAADAADAPAPPHSATLAVRVQRLTPADAYRLDGRRALFLVEADPAAGRFVGLMVQECAAPRGTLATAWLRSGELPTGPATVEATLRVVRHAAGVNRGQFFPAFTEYRLLDAVRRD